MRVLLVKGDDDYGALKFEDEMGVEKAKELIAEGKEIKSEDEGVFYGEVFEFGEVDPKFVEFIRNKIEDYDTTKHVNFYELD
jgi:hypothetical protein